MNIKNYEFRFEIKPGKFVYVPDKKSKLSGKKIVGQIAKKGWRPAGYLYHFGKKGGHVAALRPHQQNEFMASIDLRRFFESISRTKVHRALCKIGFPNKQAFDIAERSCVQDGVRKFLPYGFVQSMALATLVLETSLVGKEIESIKASGISVTMYVDDIILSSSNLLELEIAYGNLIWAIFEANLEISILKCSFPSHQVTAFNCILEKGKIELTLERFYEFKQQLVSASPKKRALILRYVGIINRSQQSVLSTVI